MAGKGTKKADIVNEYLTRFPDLGATPLARKIYKENSISFRDIEDARFLLDIIQDKVEQKIENF